MNLVWLSLTVVLLLALISLIFHTRKLSKQLRTVEADRTRFRLLLNQMPDIVTEIDPDGVIVDLNHAAEGYDRQQVIGTRCEAYLRPDVAALFREKMQLAMSTRVAQQYEVELVTGDGKPLYLSNQLIPIVSDGKLHNLLAISSNITAQVKARNVLKQERDQAEEANIAKSRFLASMSHEIRTPMNGLLGMASLLEQTELSAEQHSFLKVIQTSSEHLLAIVNDILDLSKIEADKLTIEEESFNLHSMVEDLLSMVSAKAKEQGLVLQSFIDQHVPQLVVGDAIRIRQILMNYLTNAIKFTAHGHVLLRVVRIDNGVCADSRARADSETQKIGLRFTVEDTGLGIEASKAMHLFDEYSFAHGRLSSMVGGTGLGLSICKRLATLMQGQVGVVSAPEIGSNFWLDLSLATVPRISASERDTHTQLLQNHSLWLMDEVPVNRALLVSVARRLQMPLQEFRSLDDAQQAIAQIRGSGQADSLPQVLVISWRLYHVLKKQLAPLMQQGVRLAVTFSEAISRDVEQQLQQDGVYGYWDWPISEDRLRSLLLTLAQNNQQPERLVTQYQRTGNSNNKVDDVLQGKRILLAEDNLVNQKVATQMLSKIGCEVQLAATGSEALKLYQAQPFDLILMDCHMPEMDGLEATRQIRHEESRRLESRQRIVIVALSADVMAEQKKACLAAGMDDYLAKPIRIDELRQALLTHLSPA
ncbi:response regulator [Bacterioplanoides sp.]|uniref:PAS domain-containing hybrid sensor histidine kinase/response regulator n=1 Tax=Bacterioplanoides sp. TaxID=2066072 RepID=UPI003AFF6BA9